jgi:hypothetical protein
MFQNHMACCHVEGTVFSILQSHLLRTGWTINVKLSGMLVLTMYVFCEVVTR